MTKAERKRARRKSRKLAPRLTPKHGGKRKGRALAVARRETAAANLTRDDIARTLESAPDAQAHVNSRGVVKRLDYKRT